MLQPYGLFPWCRGSQHPSLQEGWRLLSLAAGALHREKGLGNSAPSYPAALKAKLGAGVKLWCGWREGAEVAVGGSSVGRGQPRTGRWDGEVLARP